MKRIGIVGLGDMGSGMSVNLLKAGYSLTGFDVNTARGQAFADLGGTLAGSSQEVGQNSDLVFVMVLNGAQAYEVICGESGLLKGLQTGTTIVVSATIDPEEAKALIDPVAQAGVNLVDSPVSGGKSGADGGNLTLMTAAPIVVYNEIHPVLEAIGGNIFHVGETIGMGQTIKASLQAFIGSTFTAIFEALVLGVKAGAKPETLYEVFASSGVSSPLFKNCAQLIMNREFVGTGSHIGTMYKDLGISMKMAKDNGVAMFTTAAAYELFRSGISLFPEEDNWAIIKLLEQIAGTEVKFEEKR
jgi:3-hydroxyisobutyrate dehydrogenase-like beta-hydroxyacid dehydrogenase